MTAPPFPNATQRSFLQQLRTDKWANFSKLRVPMGPPGLQRLSATGWIEQRGQGLALELKLTAAGLEALRAKVTVIPSLRKKND